MKNTLRRKLICAYCEAFTRFFGALGVLTRNDLFACLEKVMADMEVRKLVVENAELQGWWSPSIHPSLKAKVQDAIWRVLEIHDTAIEG